MADEIINVLITAVGSANGLNVISALRHQNEITMRIIGVDANPLSAGLYLSDKHYIVPKIDSGKYLSYIHRICIENNVSAILPIYSKEIYLFSQNKQMFEKYNIKMLVPEPTTVKTCDDKYLFFKFLESINIASPRTYLLDNLVNNPLHITKRYIIKKRKGSGSKDTYLIKNNDDFEYYLNLLKLKDYIIQEYIEGTEYTIDFLADFKSNLVGALARERIEIRDGKCVKARSVYNEDMINTLKNIIKHLKFVGPGNLQGILTKEGKFYVTELNPRFAAGGLPLSVAMGFNIPLQVIKILLGMPPDIFLKYDEEIYMIRYLTELFLKKNKDSFQLLGDLHG